MIPKSLIEHDEYLMQGLQQEVQVMSKLKSPCIVSLYGVLETSNNYYIIQEYCDSGDLRGLLKKGKTLKEDKALLILKDILEGFVELLSHGVIHRDLKPENILIHNGKYKLADFGFAKTVFFYKLLFKG
jgi:serine/threonine protein kinase